MLAGTLAARDEGHPDPASWPAQTPQTRHRGLAGRWDERGASAIDEDWEMLAWARDHAGTG